MDRLKLKKPFHSNTDIQYSTGSIFELSKIINKFLFVRFLKVSVSYYYITRQKIYDVFKTKTMLLNLEFLYLLYLFDMYYI